MKCIEREQYKKDMKIGSHVSNSGDLMLLNSLKETISNNANCMMIYMGPPQSTQRKDINSLHYIEFNQELTKYGIDSSDVIVHAPYIVNLANPDSEKRSYAISFLSNEFKNVGIINSKYMVLHPGNHMNQGVDVGLKLISEGILQILEYTKDDNTVILLETMAGKGSECCKTFNEIKTLLDLCGNNSRIGVCLDTCHIFDSGYDIVNNYDEVMNEFDNIIGLDKIKVIHLNDSKNTLASHKDRHENIGFGNIGFNTLMKFVNDDRFKDIPKILETPYVKYNDESFSPYKYEIEMIKENKFNDKLLDLIVNKA